jgi:hypothetical protein
MQAARVVHRLWAVVVQPLRPVAAAAVACCSRSGCTSAVAAAGVLFTHMCFALLHQPGASI